MVSRWKEDGVEKVGLMGLFLGANIEQQFEFIQREWIQGDLAASGIRGTTDPIAANRTSNTEFRFLDADPDRPDIPTRALITNVPALVATRGCLYLFFPGLEALKALNSTTPQFGTLIDNTKNAINNVQVQFGTAARIVKGVANTAQDIAENAHDKLKDEFGEVRDKVRDVKNFGFTQNLNNLNLPNFRYIDLQNISNEIGEWVKQKELDKLLDGNLPQFISDLIERKLDSEPVKKLIDSFEPSTTAIQPSIRRDQGGIDLSNPRMVANPFPELKKLRSKRIIWVREQQAYWILNHADCTDLLNRNRDFVQTQTHTPFRGVVTLDVPQHDIVRGALVKAFTEALNASSKDIKNVVKEESESLLNDIHLMHFDYMQSFARPVARGFIWKLIGVTDLEQRKECDVLANTMMLTYGRNSGPGSTGKMPFADAGLRLSVRLALSLADAWRLSTPRNAAGSCYKGTLVGELAARMSPGSTQTAERPLEFIQTLLTLVQTVVASHSPHLLLGSAALHLLRPVQDPATKRLVTPWFRMSTLKGKQFTDALDTALNETRRYEPPISLIQRYANGDQNICGVTVPDKCPVFAMIGSANRDETVFKSQSEQFDWTRPDASKHLSLGYNLHKCAGEAVQAQLVPAALKMLIRKMPHLRLSNPTAVPAWYPTIYFRALQALPVERCPP